MPVPISADEVFEMACQIERDGAEFYRRARDKASDPWAAEMLTGLADMEVEHEKTLASGDGLAPLASGDKALDEAGQRAEEE